MAKNGNRYYTHLVYLDRLVKNLDKFKTEEAVKRGSSNHKKGRIITLPSGALKRVFV